MGEHAHMRTRISLAVLAAFASSCARGDVVAEVPVGSLGKTGSTTLSVAAGDRLELWEDYENARREVGKSFVSYRGDRCFQWRLTLETPAGTTTKQCWAQAVGANCTYRSNTSPGSGKDCRVEDCKLEVTATGEAKLSAQLELADRECPRTVTSAKLRVRRVR